MKLTSFNLNKGVTTTEVTYPSVYRWYQGRRWETYQRITKITLADGYQGRDHYRYSYVQTKNTFPRTEKRYSRRWDSTSGHSIFTPDFPDTLIYQGEVFNHNPLSD